LAHLKASGTLAGLVTLHHVPASKSLSVQIGYFFDENRWGKGLASEPVKSLVDYLRIGPTTRILAGMDADNGASARVLEKADFTKIIAESNASRWFYQLQT